MPFLLGLKFKTTVLLPLAFALIALKAWKALTLGLISLVVSTAVVVFKLAKPKVKTLPQLILAYNYYSFSLDFGSQVINYEVVHYPHHHHAHYDHAHLDHLDFHAVPHAHIDHHHQHLEHLDVHAVPHAHIDHIDHLAPHDIAYPAHL